MKKSLIVHNPLSKIEFNSFESLNIDLKWALIAHRCQTNKMKNTIKNKIEYKEIRRFFFYCHFFKNTYLLLFLFLLLSCNRTFKAIKVETKT